MKEIHKLGFLIFAGILLSRAGGFIFKILALKLLPLALYGEVVIFILLLNFLGSIAALGLPILITSTAGKENHEKKRFEILREFSTLLIPISLSISLFLLLFSTTVSSLLNISSISIIFLAGTIPLYTLYNLLLFYFRGTDAKVSTISEFLLSILRITIFIALFFAGAVIFSPFLSFLLAFLFSNFFMLLKLRRKKLITKLTKIKNARKILGAGFIVLIYESLRNLSIGIDRFTLSSFFNSTVSGIYDSLVLLCVFYVILANSYGIALLSQKTKIMKKLKESLNMYFKLSLLYTVFILITGKFILGIFRPELLEAFYTFPYVVVGYFIYGIFVVFIFFFTSLKRYKTAFTGTFIFLILNIIFNLYLVPELKYLGASISLTASVIIGSVFLGVKIWKEKY